MKSKYILFFIISLFSPLFVTFVMSEFYGGVFNQYIGSKNGFLAVGIFGSIFCSMILYLSISNLLPWNIFITWLIYTLTYFFVAIIGMSFAEDPVRNVEMFFSSINTWLFVFFGVLFVWIGQGMGRAKESK
jgi:hypothetical protein